MMIKNTHWWPHPADLRHDRRMKRAMHDFPGGVGYGAIVLVMEVLRCQNGFQYPMEDLDLLASELDVSLPILQTIISSYGFFKIVEEEDGKVFFSPVLNDLMIPYLEKQKKNQIAGKISAQKRKLKQEQQLYALSKLCSSEQMLDKCQTGVEQNRIENRREDKKRSLLTDFQMFKKFVLEAYKNQVICYGPSNYSNSTAISVSGVGYLHNNVSKKDLAQEDAFAVWQWMFENQDKLCDLEVLYE